MREYTKKSESQSRTLDSNPKASRQAPIDMILQRYKERNIQRYAKDEELIQGKLDTAQRKVHYNSGKPTQLQALAYAQGTDIHIAPGQEKHLPHEAWHVVQQKQGRVQPTIQLQGVNMNDNEGLEKEADVLGEKTSQFIDIPSDVVVQGKWQPDTFQKTLQRQALSVGVIDAGSRNRTQGEAIIQLLPLEVGQNDPNSVQSQAEVQAASVRNDTLSWPYNSPRDFNEDYGGSVRRALTWGLTGREGTSGWYFREYAAADFHVIATAAGNSSNNLAGIDASLDNDKNKTLIAIRAFRGPNDGGMAGCTENDLNQVFNAVNGQVAALHIAGLITNAAANVTLIEADPAEAHPNTLPTAKITFGGAGTVYFKGRSHAIEDALVGSGPSAARALSSIAGADADGTAGVGMHRFVALDPGGLNQIAGDVGNEVVPDLTPVTGMEKFRSHLPGWLGGADISPRPEAVAAWLSAAKGALLASLTATTDLHPSNIVAGRSGKKHIIDGEFLLDIMQWQAYKTMIEGGAIANFNIVNFVPPWLQQHTAGLSQGTKALMANEVATAFIALGANNIDIQTKIIAPLRLLIQTPALLRVIPLGTDEFLSYVTEYHNKPNAFKQVALVRSLWFNISNAMNNIITMANPITGKIELRHNLHNGMVPLFHVRANDGIFLLNKQVNIGNADNHHSVEDLLNLAVNAISHRYEDMAGIVRTQITTM